MITYKDCIIIGKISKVYHKDCSLVVHSHTDFPDRFLELKKFFILNEKEECLIKNSYSDYFEFNIEKVLKVSNYFRVNIAGYNNIEICESICGYFVGIKERERHILKENKHYYYDLIGLKVYDGNKMIGILNGIEDYGSGDLLKIELDSNIESDSRFILVPFIKDFVIDINIDEKVINLNLISGFY